MIEEVLPKPASASRMSLAIIAEPNQLNPFGILHGGVLLKLADECGGIAAMRHAGRGQVTTAAIDSFTYLTPVRVGERVELWAEVTWVGRTSIETRIEIFAESVETAERRMVALGYGLYVALDDAGHHPRPVAPLLVETEAGRRAQEAARARQAIRLARRAEARGVALARLKGPPA
jgi:uncharacterized protein (TIGR00369 family)